MLDRARSIFGPSAGVGGNDPWPVYAKGLLTAREQAFYQTLHSLYPDRKVFVQVALSQLVDVREDHPRPRSYRNRFDRLVLDFVLCDADMTLIAAIEVDDLSHERADRKSADARKSKALRDAGLRLIRIPAGALPGPERLRALIDDDERWAPRTTSSLTPVQLLSEYRVDASTPNATHHEAKPKRNVPHRGKHLRIFASNLFFEAIFALAGLGFVYFAATRIMPSIIRPVFQSVLVLPTPTAPVPARRPAGPAVITTSALPVNAPQVDGQQLMEKKIAQSNAAAALEKQKYQAWLVYFPPTPACEHPADWPAQVECGNQYIRAKRRFEAQWEALHPGALASGLPDK